MSVRAHLKPVAPPRPRRLNSRKEIAEWVSERQAVLTRLQEQEAQQRPLFDPTARRAA
jgi:hypothetical protein